MDTQHRPRRARCAAYSLIEVLVATGIITMGVAVAASLSFSMTGQEEAGNNISRALAVQENSARLFRLGLSGDEIIRLLPPDPLVYSITITEDAPVVTGAGTMDRAIIVIEYDISPVSETWDAGEWTGGPGGALSRRTHTVTALRPQVRAGY